MTTQQQQPKFNVGETVFYKSPNDSKYNDTGVVLEVNIHHYSHGDTVGYCVKWDNGGSDWITGENLTSYFKFSVKKQITLDQTKVLVKETEKKLKTTIENILQEFEQKTGIKPEFYYDNGYTHNGENNCMFKVEIK